ncbi:uncharacterized protein CLUP02_11202 [Colletotrichum lupini]|uniref:Uncharacterized protein n=1 Tax=Colletotrichum lupini TaxID=145971 RepID=A0A9Q8WJ97_9PEZI|nr:uncharacterized protein CLUP02_11202 [Colletotrichum lupini]UQC85703.1 hypothetical protein CLUP02_11202 [Colletotrichum lupini]
MGLEVPTPKRWVRFERIESTLAVSNLGFRVSLAGSALFRAELFARSLWGSPDYIIKSCYRQIQESHLTVNVPFPPKPRMSVSALKINRAVLQTKLSITNEPSVVGSDLSSLTGMRPVYYSKRPSKCKYKGSHPISYFSVCRGFLHCIGAALVYPSLAPVHYVSIPAASLGAITTSKAALWLELTWISSNVSFLYMELNLVPSTNIANVADDLPTSQSSMQSIGQVTEPISSSDALTLLAETTNANAHRTKKSRQATCIGGSRFWMCCQNYNQQPHITDLRCHAHQPVRVAREPLAYTLPSLLQPLVASSRSLQTSHPVSRFVEASLFLVSCCGQHAALVQWSAPCSQDTKTSPTGRSLK